MAGPFDYTLKGIQSPMDSFASGLQLGGSIQDRQRQREAAEQKAAQEAQMQADMDALSGNPTVGGIQQMMSKYPAMSDKFKPLLESMTATQKENRIRQANSIFMPLISGDKDLAISQLDEQITAATNSGDVQSQKSLGALKKTLESEKTGQLGDSLVTIAMGSFLAEAMGPEQFAKTYETIAEQRRKEEVAPVLLSTAKAEAKIKENEAQGIMPPKFVETETGIMQWDTQEGKLVPTGYKPKKPSGVNINMGTPQFAIEEATGEQVIYQPMTTGGAQIIRGLRPVTEQTKQFGKEAAKFEKLSSVIDIARKTLKDASGSYIGAGIAAVQRGAGVSSQTTKANAKLKALQAAMMMNMPRMEGPQSDKDVQIYREQAGQIGDPTVPIEDRLAALDVLGEIMSRYKTTKPSKKQAAPEPPAGAGSVDELMKLLGKQ